jgi:transposase-like protein
MPMQCPHCQSETVVKNGTRRLQDDSVVQYYRCRNCHRNFNERTGTPMARLRTPSQVVEFALKNRSEGMGARATGRVFDKSHTTVLRWEERLAEFTDAWSPPVPEGSDVTLEGDEVYTRVGENLSPL